MILHNLVESGFVLGLFINAALFIPQMMRIIANKDAKEVSFITFFGFWIIQLATVLHGLIRKDYILALGTIPSMLTCAGVIGLILYYRGKDKVSRD